MKKRKTVLHFKKSKIASLNKYSLRGGGLPDDFTVTTHETTDVQLGCTPDTEGDTCTRTRPKTSPENPCSDGCVFVADTTNGNGTNQIGTTGP